MWSAEQLGGTKMKPKELKCPVAKEIVETAKDFPIEYKKKLLSYAEELKKRKV